MAARNILATDTLETFRTQFNALAADDFGDIGTLDASLTATTVIGAVNELSSIVAASLGHYIEDSSSTVQLIGSGQTVRYFGTSNQTIATVSAPDTLTVGLANDVTIPNNLTVTGNIQNVVNITASGNLGVVNINATGPTHTLGTIQISGNEISSTDSTAIKFDDEIETTAVNISANLRFYEAGGFPYIKSNRPDKFLIFQAAPIIDDNKIIFEGSVADGNETSLVVAEPTSDQTVTIPNSTGTIILDNTTGYAYGTIFNTSVTLVIYNSAGVAQKTIVGSAS